MLMVMLGRCSPAPAEVIARRILGEVSSQIEYHNERVKRMVERVLTSNGITSHAGGVYSLIGADDLSEIERDALLQLLPPGPVHWADAEQRQLAWVIRRVGMEGVDPPHNATAPRCCASLK